MEKLGMCALAEFVERQSRVKEDGKKAHGLDMVITVRLVSSWSLLASALNAIGPCTVTLSRR